MTDVIKTSERVAPPSIALAKMAMHLAEDRAEAEQRGHRGFWTKHKIEPLVREYVNPATHRVSAEFYRIIDRISAGEAP